MYVFIVPDTRHCIVQKCVCHQCLKYITGIALKRASTGFSIVVVIVLLL
jgi:hypothetical protein